MIKYTTWVYGPEEEEISGSFLIYSDDAVADIEDALEERAREIVEDYEGIRDDWTGCTVRAYNLEGGLIHEIEIAQINE